MAINFCQQKLDFDVEEVEEPAEKILVDKEMLKDWFGKLFGMDEMFRDRLFIIQIAESCRLLRIVTVERKCTCFQVENGWQLAKAVAERKAGRMLDEDLQKAVEGIKKDDEFPKKKFRQGNFNFKFGQAFDNPNQPQQLSQMNMSQFNPMNLMSNAPQMPMNQWQFSQQMPDQRFAQNMMQSMMQSPFQNQTQTFFGNQAPFNAPSQGQVPRQAGPRSQCYNCQGFGHFSRDCPLKPAAQGAPPK